MIMNDDNWIMTSVFAMLLTRQSVVCGVLLLCCAQAQGGGGGDGSEEVQSLSVRISQGPLRGYKPSDADYYVFYNIPYATAPSGQDRFKAPLPGPVWLTERKAVDENVICPQTETEVFSMGNKTRQENCLIANVYVPDTDQKNLPVVVYVHGGAFQIGYGEMSVPKSMMESKKMIAVTFNYRLGIHGFLCLGTQDAPGNAGMKDQVALLRWVKKNIAKFGGNPNDVTIDGFSAGSSSVDLLMLSETAKGLFHKAIPESGGNLSPWGVQVDPIHNARSFAEENFGFEGGDDIYALEKLYKHLPYEELTKFFLIERQHFYFVPCVERDTGVERFLKKSPYEILKEGKYNKVPMLYGFSNMEGLFRINFFDTWKDKMNANFAEFLPVDLQFTDEKEKQSVAERVKQFYFGKMVDDNSKVSYVDYFTDVIFAVPMLWATRLQVKARNNDIYLYMYSFAEEALSKLTGITDPKLVGANHCAQTYMTLESNFMALPDEMQSVDFKKMKSTMIEIWTNFITTGNPVPEDSSLPAWPAANEDGSPYMNLDRTLELRGPLLEKRAKFWLDIYDNYYHIPTAPPSPTKHSEL